MARNSPIDLVFRFEVRLVSLAHGGKRLGARTD